MTEQDLLNEIENDPAGMGYEGKTPTEIAVLLNAPTRTYPIQPETASLTAYLYNEGLYAKLIAHYRDHPSKGVQVAAECALDMAASQLPTINLQNPNAVAMMNGLVAGGVWTQAELDALLAFSSATRSRAEELWAQSIGVGFLARALWPEDFTAAESELSAAQYKLDQLNAGIREVTE
jgi:hypothetical protein